MARNSSVDGSEGLGAFFEFDIAQDATFRSNFGRGIDVVSLSNSGSVSQVRLTFTSAQVGNNNPRDGSEEAPQDGGLAVRLQAESADGTLAADGNVSRTDDEGISFISDGSFTFDVRDISGVGRGDYFSVVRLGTNRRDLFDEPDSALNTYINGGAGNDSITTGNGSDFLVGGAGNDTLNGGAGDDDFIGGAGDDAISGGAGNDVLTMNFATDGTDRVNLGTGDDAFYGVGGTDGPTQVRLTFATDEVGNGSANDSNTGAGQDGGLAVQLQSEGGEDEEGLVGGVTRVDDEGVSFFSDGSFTFDVRDVNGERRGDYFEIVRLGSAAADIVDDSSFVVSAYHNGGAGNDQLTGSQANDYLIGGEGDDVLSGGLDSDLLSGGAGADRISGGDGDDIAVYTIGRDGADTVNLGLGADAVNVTSSAAVTQVRLTFTSAEVGNGNAADGGTLEGQDGRLAVRMQAEGEGGLIGDVSRYDDEGITFYAKDDFTFDVRDLVSGAERGASFKVVTLGTASGDTYDESDLTSAWYVNGGGGDDIITSGSGNDFLVGGAGDDTLNGGAGNNSLLGGLGADTFVFGEETGRRSTILDFDSGVDKIDLSAFDIDQSNVAFSFNGTTTVLRVDTDDNGSFETRITLTGAEPPVAGDYVF